MIQIKRVDLHQKPAPKYDLYMGRENKWLNLPRSKWANPFWMKNEGMRQEVLDKYRKYISETPELLNSIHELDGLTLGCWCEPNKKCHIDILVELSNENL